MTSSQPVTHQTANYLSTSWPVVTITGVPDGYIIPTAGWWTVTSTSLGTNLELIQAAPQHVYQALPAPLSRGAALRKAAGNARHILENQPPQPQPHQP